MTRGDFQSQLHRLVTGLVDQDIKGGNTFSYDGGELHAEEVSDIALSSILCIAQDLSLRLGMGDFGFDFELTDSGEPVFPLRMSQARDGVTFMTVAPLVVEVFEREVRECRHDLAHLFEMAAQRIDVNYTLRTRTTYSAAAPREATPPSTDSDLEK